MKYVDAGTIRRLAALSAIVVIVAVSHVRAQGESTSAATEQTLPGSELFTGDLLLSPSDTAFVDPFDVVIPSIRERTPLPKIPTRDYENLRAPVLPARSAEDSIAVDQIDTRRINDPELRARADSLNTHLRSLAIQERLIQSQVRGDAPRTGLITRRDFLLARVDLLESMETDLKEQLQRRISALDSEIDDLDSTVNASRDREIDALQRFIDENPNSRELADAKFILGQLVYERENQRYIRSTLRFNAELNRWRLGLIPVMPRRPVMNEAAPVPYYEDVVHLGTNEQLIPYSLYSLGKYHLERSRDMDARATDVRFEGETALAREYQQISRAHSDTSKLYFARLVSEFPDDSINVPEAYFVLASHYNVLGGIANRDTAAVYARALVRDHWYSPRFQNALSLLAEVSFYNGLALSFSEPARSQQYYSDALAYLSWLAHEIDMFQARQIPGVSPDPPSMMNTGRRDQSIRFMTQIITRRSPLPQLVPPPPVETAMEVVNATQQAPFGAELLRQVGDELNDRYMNTLENSDLVLALTAYDSLLAIYPTYQQGPDIQQKIINNATYLSNDPQERINIFIRQKLSFFERFNRNSDWAREANVPASQAKAVDDSAAAYLEQASKYLYTSARDAGDSRALREALDNFVTYFETYPDRPQAYELNWSVATELRDLGDYERAYDEFMRVSREYEMDDHRRDAAVEAVAAAQRLVQQEEQNAPNAR